MSRPAPAPVEVIRGDGPVVLGMPHVSDHVPDAIRAGLNETGLALADTDWHIDALYDGLLPGATIVKAGFHRYVIDANRDPARAQPLSRPEHHRPGARRPISTAARSIARAARRGRKRSRSAAPPSTRPITPRCAPS
jgi:N-formylglutamate amidohydrolase